MKKKCDRSFSSDPFEYYRTPSAALLNELHAENARTLRYIDGNLRLEIEKEIIDISNSIPDPLPELGPSGKYFYMTKDLESGLRTYQRRCAATNKVQEMLEISLQLNQLHSMSISVDESIMAYLVSSSCDTGSTKVKVRLLDSHREIDIKEIGENYIVSIEWGPIQDNGDHSLFLITQNHLHRPDTVYVCTVSNDLKQSTPSVVFFSDDEKVMVDVQRTKGCCYVAISARTKTSNEIHLVGSLKNKPILVRCRQTGVQYHVDVGCSNDVWIVANASEPNHESGLAEEITVFETSIDVLPLRNTFGKVRAESNEYIIYDIDLFRKFVVFYQRSSFDGRQRMQINNRMNWVSSIVDIPGDSCSTLLPGGNIYFDAKSLRFSVECPFSEGTVHEVDLDTSVVKDMSSLSRGRDLQYLQQRILVTSYDGVRVPLTLIHSCSIDPFGSDHFPVVLHGYGAYGEPVMRGFDPGIIPLLDRGFIVAFAHTRGGGELGRAWYRAGRLYEKRNVVEDFLACAEYLTSGITLPSQLSAKAFSAGGVVVGAAINARPELFGSVVFTNAFLDVTSSMKDPRQRLTEHEYDEWGNPVVDKKAADLVASYCPFSNLKSTSVYPKVLLIGTLDDDNVPFWHSVTFQRKYNKLNVPGRGEGALNYTVKTGGHNLHGRRLDVASLESAFIVGNSMRAGGAVHLGN